MEECQNTFINAVTKERELTHQIKAIRSELASRNNISKTERRYLEDQLVSLQEERSSVRETLRHNEEDEISNNM